MVGERGFSGVAGELRMVSFTDGRTELSGDVNGDRVADFVLTVFADQTMSAADLVL